MEILNNWKFKVFFASAILIIITSYVFYEQLQYKKYFNNFKITKAKLNYQHKTKNYYSTYIYYVNSLSYEGSTGNTEDLYLGKSYYLIYSLKNPKYNIVVWEIPVDEKLLKDDIDINDYIGFGKQRIDKAIIIDD